MKALIVSIEGPGIADDRYQITVRASISAGNSKPERILHAQVFAADFGGRTDWRLLAATSIREMAMKKLGIEIDEVMFQDMTVVKVSP